MGEKAEEKKTMEQLKEKIEEHIKKFVEQGIQTSNIDFVYKLVDIHKDLANEEYWKIKEEKYMNYRGYGEGYGRGGYSGEYGRRGVRGSGRGRYRGEDAMMEMQENYDEYNEASQEMYRGNYGAEDQMVQSVEAIGENMIEIVKELSKADEPQVKRALQKVGKEILKISEMR